MAIRFTKAFKKECVKAHAEVQSHFWGDKGNAGKNYQPHKNSGRHNPSNPIGS